MTRKERRAASSIARYYQKAGSIDIDGGYESVVAKYGEENIVTIGATMGEATIKSAFPINKIDEALAGMDRVAREIVGGKATPRASAMTFVIDAMKKGDHLKQPSGSTVVGILLWLACRHPDYGPQMENALRMGAQSVWWIITLGEKGHGNNWRLVFNDTPDSVADIPTPVHPRHAGIGHHRT